jgi:hypothetical protein
MPLDNRRLVMVKVALFVRLEAKPGKEKEVESFLMGGLPSLHESMVGQNCVDRSDI